MNKKILIGSIFVLTLLLLMQSIPAIQHTVIKDKVKEEMLSEKLKEVREVLNTGSLERVRHPVLLAIILSWMGFRLIRCSFLISISLWWADINTPIVDYPLLFIRGVWLYETSIAVLIIWNILSNILGWNWNVILPW